MPRIDTFSAAHLQQLAQLVNLHLTAVIPGWALSEAALARHLERDDSEPVTDPWVAERITRCSLEGDRVLAADDADDAVQRFYRRFGGDVLTRETRGWRAVSREGRVPERGASLPLIQEKAS